jgi:hypothetical protein
MQIYLLAAHRSQATKLVPVDVNRVWTGHSLMYKRFHGQWLAWYTLCFHMFARRA